VTDRGARWPRLLLLVASLALSLAAAELVLRRTGTRPPPPLLRDVGGGKVELTAPRGHRPPRAIARRPPRPRVVFMGASTVVGEPYDPRMSPPRWLQLVLDAWGVDAAVVSVAAGGRTCAGLLGWLPEVFELSPTAVVLATGHNEFLQAERLLDRTWWRRFALGRRLEAALGAAPPPVRRMPTLERRFDRDAVVSAFRRLLADFVDRCADAGVPVLVCTPVANLADCPPVLGDDPRADEDGDAAWRRGHELRAGGDLSDARDAYERARDVDRWPHRAPSEIVAAVRELAPVLVDVERVFRREAEDGLPGFDLFVDHCHPNARGQWLLASTAARALVQHGVLSPSPSAPVDVLGFDDGMEAMDMGFWHLLRGEVAATRTFLRFALLRDGPGPMSDLVRQRLAAARDGDVDHVSHALLSLVEGDAAATLDHAARIPDGQRAKLQAFHDRFPWVAAAFRRAGLELAAGVVSRRSATTPR